MELEYTEEQMREIAISLSANRQGSNAYSVGQYVDLCQVSGTTRWYVCAGYTPKINQADVRETYFGGKRVF